MARRRRGPTLRLERELWDAGAEVVVGLDEVGRGAWAGPLTIAAVVLPRDRRVYGVRDSKQLTEARREQLFDRVKDWCDAVGVGHVEHDECDALGMSDAQRLAARRALDALGVVPDEVLVDGPWDFVGGGSTHTVVRGDATSLSIAAASIVAKVSRDRIMRERAEHYPAFDLDRNKGYPCPRHKLALKGYGPTPIHRRSWAFMDNLPWLCRRREPVGAQAALFEAPMARPPATGPTW
jgi:ribonuclease HII